MTERPDYLKPVPDTDGATALARQPEEEPIPEAPVQEPPARRLQPNRHRFRKRRPRRRRPRRSVKESAGQGGACEGSAGPGGTVPEVPVKSPRPDHAGPGGSARDYAGHRRPDAAARQGPLGHVHHRRPGRARLRREGARQLRRRGARAGPHARVDPGRAEGHRLQPALARSRRALRPLPPRPQHLQGRHGGFEPDLARRGPPLQRGPGRLPAGRHRAPRHVGPLRRDRDRRRPDDHGFDLPRCGRGSRGHRSADPSPQHTRLAR